MSLTALAFWITYVTGVCAAVFNPIWGLALYVLVYHLNPETQWWGATVAALDLRTSLTVAIATAIGILVRRVRLQPGARQFPTPYVLAVFLGLVAVGSLVWGVGVTPRGEYQAEKLIKLLILLFMLLRCVHTPQQYHLLVMAWLVGVLYLGHQAFGGAGGIISGRLTYGLGGPDFAESSGLAVHLLATLPLIGAVFFMSRTWWGRLFALATGALAVNTLIMTRTRSALAGLAVITVTTVLHLPRRYRVKGLAAVVLGTLLAAQLADPAWWRRMRTVAQFRQDQSAMGRLAYWKAAVEIASDYPFGIGLGTFHDVVKDYVPGLTIPRSAHNTFIACLAELGWPGLLLFLATLAIPLWKLGRIRRLTHELPAHVDIRIWRFPARFHLGWHTVALRAALLGYLACAMFTTRLLAEDLWLLLGLAMCLDNVARGMAGDCRLAMADGRPPMARPQSAIAHRPSSVVHKVPHAAAH